MSEKIKVIIAGSRHFNDYEFFCDKVTGVLKDIERRVNGGTKRVNFEIISGGARGADTLAMKFACHDERYKPWRFKFRMFPADWEVWGKSAGPMRNKDMAYYAGEEGILIVFWDGHSKGTNNMISNAKKIGMEVHVFRI